MAGARARGFDCGRRTRARARSPASQAALGLAGPVGGPPVGGVAAAAAAR